MKPETAAAAAAAARRPARPLARGLAAALGLAALASCSQAPPPDTHPQRWVSQRQAIFKDFTRTLEPIGLAARERQPYNPSAVVGQVLALQALAQRPWALFPPDSQYPPTRARPAVWTDRAAFEQAQADFTQAVDALLAAAQTGSLPALKPAVERVQDSCKRCHEQFRLDAPSR